jgi:hypothetical protein
MHISADLKIHLCLAGILCGLMILLVVALQSGYTYWIVAGCIVPFFLAGPVVNSVYRLIYGRWPREE